MLPFLIGFLFCCTFPVTAGGEGQHVSTADGTSYHCNGSFTTINLENQTLIIKKNGVFFCRIESSTRPLQTVSCEGQSQAYLANWTCLYLRNFQGQNDIFLLEYGRPQEHGKIAFLNQRECRNTAQENGTLGQISHGPKKTRNRNVLIGAITSGAVLLFGVMLVMLKTWICSRCSFRQQLNNP
ncbi:hypothetical protein XELAEV_18036485mg [Xenopus laevis]|uniref:Uncharacterized protein n=1 Tax=Xenopus laevis TaxID=8355 RepID=A0A974CHL6_XENLA|nr:hypothetical protein XELAEV_18036485mg [Xenopus laevis]